MSTIIKTTVKQSKLPGFLSMLLVIALGVSLAKLMWLILTPAPQLVTNAVNKSTNNLVSSPQIKQQNYGKTISDLHLFGEIKKVAIVKAPVKVVEPKDTKPAPAKLDLKLHGIVAYKNKKGYALISSNGREQKVYGKGDKIEDGVTISNLFPEKVIINNHGTTEELILPRKTTKTSGLNSPQSLLSNQARARTRRPTSTPPPSGLQNEDEDDPENRAPPPRVSNSNAPDLGTFRKEILKNPAKLMDVATPSPAVDAEGKFIGFRLQPGNNRQIFRQMGLRANDIVTSVNGITLDDPSKGAMVLGELSQASSVSLIIQRGDETLTLSHDF